jgi:hypothetical protein
MDAATESGTLNKKVKIGLVLALVIGVLDIAGLAMPTPEGDAAGPPIGVLVFSGLMGVATIVLAVIALRKRNRNAVRGVVITRFLSALSAVPAFFVSGVPGAVVVLVAVFIVLTVVTIALVMSTPFLVERSESVGSVQPA